MDKHAAGEATRWTLAFAVGLLGCLVMAVAMEAYGLWVLGVFLVAMLCAFWCFIYREASR